LPLDDILRSDAGVIGSRNPEDVITIHPFIATENILERVIQGVADVERSRDIGRRNHHGEGSAISTRRLEVTRLNPPGIPLLLNLSMRVSLI
jgi:hypothetical protein